MSYISVLHPNGSYKFLPAIPAYSAGVAAMPGYEIAALRFLDSPSLAHGFERIDREISSRGLPSSALVGLELRCPAAFDFDGFAKFNDQYRQLLVERALLIGDTNPVARTNVIPIHEAPTEPSIFTAFIVHPSSVSGGVDFIVAGAGEVNGNLGPENIVARGDINPQGLLKKANFVLDEMEARLVALGADTNSPTTINVYTAHDIDHLCTLMATRLPAAGRNGFVRWLAQPPISEIEFEMDCRKFSSWWVI